MDQQNLNGDHGVCLDLVKNRASGLKLERDPAGKND